jgi:ADP-heptose:LPS heptosyltransferase
LWKSAALAFMGGVKRRIGFSSATIREFAVPVLYTDRVRATAKHIADQNGELSLRAGARSGVAAFSLHLPAADESTAAQFLRDAGIDRYIVLSPGGGWRSKCWPPERFGALCGKIHSELGLRCIVNYGPGEKELAAAVLATSGEAAPLLYDGELGPLMEILRRALCVVGGDTGPLHLAVALGTPGVALFGPTDPARNGPYRQVNPTTGISAEDIVLRAPGVTTTHRRGNHPHPSMLAIEVTAVFDAVRCRIGDVK